MMQAGSSDDRISFINSSDADLHCPVVMMRYTYLYYYVTSIPVMLVMNPDFLILSMRPTLNAKMVSSLASN